MTVTLVGTSGGDQIGRPLDRLTTRIVSRMTLAVTSLIMSLTSVDQSPMVCCF